jgi:hypothetical protein
MRINESAELGIDLSSPLALAGSGRFQNTEAAPQVSLDHNTVRTGPIHLVG